MNTFFFLFVKYAYRFCLLSAHPVAPPPWSDLDLGGGFCSKSLNFFCDQSTQVYLRFFKKKEKKSLLLFQWENAETPREVFHLSQLHSIKAAKQLPICCDSSDGTPLINYFRLGLFTARFIPKKQKPL